MSISWERWQAMQTSLAYCWVRMGELSRLEEEPANRPEYDSVVEQALETANRLLQFAGPYTPDLSTVSLRERWNVGRGEAMALRERIVARVLESEDAADVRLRAEAE